MEEAFFVAGSGGGKRGYYGAYAGLGLEKAFLDQVLHYFVCGVGVDF